MKNNTWVKINNEYINLEKVTNIVLDAKDMSIMFIFDNLRSTINFPDKEKYDNACLQLDKKFTPHNDK